MSFPESFHLFFYHKGETIGVNLWEESLGKDSPYSVQIAGHNYHIRCSPGKLEFVHHLLHNLDLKKVSSEEDLQERLSKVEGISFPSSLSDIHKVASKSIELSPKLSSVSLPFEVQCKELSLKSKIDKIFQILYSKEFFGSGKEACCLVLDTFAKLATQPSFPIRVQVGHVDQKEAREGDVHLGTYVPLKQAIIINSQLLHKLDIEALNKESLQDVLGTIIHEMTHAIHYDKFITAGGISSENLEEEDLQKELGVSREEYHSAISKAAHNIPLHLKYHSVLALDLITEMKNFYFAPAEIFFTGRDVVSFNEFLARIPEMYCRYGRAYSREEIDKALSQIFPLGFEFFWGQFKNACLGSLDHFNPTATNTTIQPSSASTAINRKETSETAAKKFIQKIYSNLEAYNSLDRALLNKFKELATTVDDPQHIDAKVYSERDGKGSKGASAQLIAECLRKGCHHDALNKNRELMFSESFLMLFDQLLLKNDSSSEARINEMIQLVVTEIKNLLSEIGIEEAVTRQVAQNSARSLFRMIFDNLSAYDPGEQVALKKFRELSTTPHISQRIETKVYKKGDKSKISNPLSRKAIEQCLQKGCNHCIISQEAELMFSEDFLINIDMLSEKSDQKSRDLIKEMIAQVITEIKELIHSVEES